MEHDLQVTNLSKVYTSTAEDLVVLKDLSFHLDRGQSLAITGPSGTGKSTLLHILGTLDKPTSGTVLLEKRNPFDLSENLQAKFRNEHIGFIFQDHHLLPQLTVLENTLLPALATGSVTDELVERAETLLDAVGMSPRIGYLPGQLSGGERERVAVARSLLLRPTLVLADEPTGNLDPTNAEKVAKLLIDLQKKENTLLVVVTHSTEIAALMDHQLKLTSKATG